MLVLSAIGYATIFTHDAISINITSRHLTVHFDAFTPRIYWLLTYASADTTNAWFYSIFEHV